MYSSFYLSLSAIQIIVIGILLITFVVQLLYYLGCYTKVLVYKNKIKKDKIPFNTTQPAVSVIVCAKNESENLAKLLPSVLEQVYPSYEVIVINDGSTDESEDLLVILKQKYPHLRTSFVPQAAKYIDSKKIAVVLGIKAAKNDILLFTDADCMPKRPDWIEKMVRNFDDSTEIVLGYGAYRQEKGFLNHLIGYDTLFIAVQYLNFALAKKNLYGCRSKYGVSQNSFL